jgi:hypothetical protein
MAFNEFQPCLKKLELTRGLHCKACDKPIDGDPELCPTCLSVARSLITDIDKPDEDFSGTER